MNKTNRKNIVDIVYSQISNVIELRTYGVERITNCIEKCATVKAYEKIIETNLTLKSDSLKDFIDENSNKEATDAEQKR